MARKKEQPKPLFAVKHDFYASLDHLAQEAIMLLQAIDMALRSEQIPDPAASILRERAASFRAALSRDEEPEGE